MRLCSRVVRPRGRVIKAKLHKRLSAFLRLIDLSFILSLMLSMLSTVRRSYFLLIVGGFYSEVALQVLVLTFCIIRQGLMRGSGPSRLIKVLGIGTGNRIMTYEQQSSFLPSTERAPHHTPTGIPEGRCSFAIALSLALPNPLSPLLVTRRHIPKLFQGGPRTELLSG